MVYQILKFFSFGKDGGSVKKRDARQCYQNRYEASSEPLLVQQEQQFARPCSACTSVSVCV